MLACKGRILLSGNELMRLQQMQFGQLQAQSNQDVVHNTKADDTPTDTRRSDIKSKKSNNEGSVGCFVGSSSSQNTSKNKKGKDLKPAKGPQKATMIPVG